MNKEFKKKKNRSCSIYTDTCTSSWNPWLSQWFLIRLMHHPPSTFLENAAKEKEERLVAIAPVLGGW